jgi:Flp pilus assembly protein TadG
MSITRSRLLAARKGVAALELAIVAPVFLAMLGALADFGLANRAEARLATGIDSSAIFAFGVGQQTIGSPQAFPLAGVIATAQAAIMLPGATVTATAPATYCLSGTAGLAANAPGTLCPDGSAPGTYTTITATYVYEPLMPTYSMMASSTLRASASVRLY